MGSRILVVEDEIDLAELVAFHLRESGHVVIVSGTGATALAEVKRQKPDLVVLDVMLPDISGIEVCRRLRRDDDTRRLPRELLLRIEAVLRRATAPIDDTGPATISLGAMTIDVPAHRVLVNDEEVPLTALEFRLLMDLASRLGRVQSRDALLERVWGYSPGVETVRGVGYRLRETLS